MVFFSLSTTLAQSCTTLPLLRFVSFTQLHPTMPLTTFTASVAALYSPLFSLTKLVLHTTNALRLGHLILPFQQRAAQVYLALAITFE